MSKAKIVELRLQKIEANTATGRLITFIKKGVFNGASISATQLAVQILSMCLQPYADREVLDENELKRLTASCVELMLIHCRNLCSWAGLDFSSFFSTGFTEGNVLPATGITAGKAKGQKKQVDDDSPEEDFSMAGSLFEELEIR